MRLVVGVSDMKVSNQPQNKIVTYSLGSCIGLAVYDPAVNAGGILHYMLPESSLDTIKAQINPYMFADTGIPALFEVMAQYSAEAQDMKVVVAGGAQVLNQRNIFNIGKRNQMALHKILDKNHVKVDFEDVGGNVNRTVTLDLKTGDVIIKVSGGEEKII
ncbi:MAG: chemotaxis protein CheD [Desulfobacterales bacterium]|nr:chemotaxis protein CheD [Desulfobacterales bacterium]MDJ0912683.1 chemotaxis protein CheD [Desulfobacterales bacterium]